MLDNESVRVVFDEFGDASFYITGYFDLFEVIPSVETTYDEDSELHEYVKLTYALVGKNLGYSDMTRGDLKLVKKVFKEYDSTIKALEAGVNYFDDKERVSLYE